MAVDRKPPQSQRRTGSHTGNGQWRDTSLIWRLSLWAGAATVAVAAAILMTFTDTGYQRLQVAFSAPAAPQQDTARLEAQVRDLTADRERLNARIAGLEQSLSDVTGSIKRELAIVAATAPAAPPPDKPQAKPESMAKPMPETVTPSITPATPPPAPLQALAALQNGEADEDAQGIAPPLGPPVRLPPRPVIAALPVGDQIAVDLGGARSMEILQARWIAVKANFGPYLTGLRPLAVRDHRRGVIPYRLIVGPLPNAAAAAEICKRFAASHVGCRSTKFAGEPLVIQ